MPSSPSESSLHQVADIVARRVQRHTGGTRVMPLVRVEYPGADSVCSANNINRTEEAWASVLGLSVEQAERLGHIPENPEY